jgi:hypothetical protein
MNAGLEAAFSERSSLFSAEGAEEGGGLLG